MGQYISLEYATNKSYSGLADVVADLQDVTAVHNDGTATTVADANLRQTETGPRLSVSLEKPASASELEAAGDALAQTIVGLGLEASKADAQDKIDLQA
jgi:hypothetical protein